jgi:DNA helicase-2/ATP-dependent DNA helicase PcrA
MKNVAAVWPGDEDCDRADGMVREHPRYLQQLNSRQRAAVETTEGPLLVLAGAGTGKTRVLTCRIAHILLTQRAIPSQILAVTFTNKAANEMRERLVEMVGRSAEGLWLGTFHAMCLRMLRRYAELVDYPAHFTILDSDDQLRLIKQVMKAENIDDKQWPPRVILSAIGRWKDRGITPERVQRHELVGQGDPSLQIYDLYQLRLKTLKVIDFGDIMLLTLELFKKHPAILHSYQQQFQYMLVDEYQDTNVVQYLWLRALALGRANICCVGDDDQSIYGWRGAEVSNILRFEKDFPGAVVIRLEENYRSTPHILGAASALIAHNKGRLGKTLWTQQEEGEKVIVRGVWDGDEEARFVGEEIEALQRRGENLSDIAILVRAGFQTREFEERLMTIGIPYLVIGGPRFYERQEIRDALAYLRVVVQPDDSLAFERIINVPKRGIGPAALQMLYHYGRQANTSLAEAARALLDTDEIPAKTRQSLRALLMNLDRWRAQKPHLTPAALAEMVLDESGYTRMWLQDKSPEAPGRLENLKELINALREFESLEAFLEHVSLVMENNSPSSNQDKVSIMTLHASKGLEFNTIFLAGWEEEIFPSLRALKEKGDEALEEERRLAYVGMTRARKRAFISYAANRKVYGGWQSSVPSRFIDELPPEHVERVKSHGFYHYHAPHRPYASHRSLLGSSTFSRGLSPFSGDHQTPCAEGEGFKEGDRVFHQKFGYGYVLCVQGDKVDVDFQHAGTKRVINTFLEKAQK